MIVTFNLWTSLSNPWHRTAWRPVTPMGCFPNS